MQLQKHLTTLAVQPSRVCFKRNILRPFVRNFIPLFIILGSVACKSRSTSKIKGLGDVSPRQDGACGASGVWTETAHEKADKMMQTIKTLSERKECAALVNNAWKLEQIKAFTTSPSQLNYRVAKFMTLPRDIASIGTFMELSGGKSELQGLAKPSLLNRVFQLRSAEAEVMVESNMASNLQTDANGRVNITREMQGLHSRLLKTGTTGLNRLGEFFETMTASPDCFGTMGSMQSEFLLTSAQLLGAFASADPATTAQIGRTVQKYVNFVNTGFARRLQQTQTDMQLRETISCLLDVVTYSYCGARDAKVLLDLGIERKERGAPVYDGKNAFYGLDVLTNRIPTVNAWLLQITQGVVMRNDQNKMLMVDMMKIPVALLRYRKIIDLKFDQAMYKIAAMDPGKTQTTAMAQLLFELAQIISRADFQKGANTTVPNLLDGQKKTYRIPFLLGGVEEKDIPHAAIPGDQAAVAQLLSVVDVVNINGPFESMKTFESFRATLRKNLNGWMDSAISYGMDFFWRNYPIDYVAVASQGVAGQYVTPIDALRAVQTYIYHYLQVAKESKNTSMVSLGYDVLDLLKRINAILDAYTDLSKSGDPEKAKDFVRLVYQKLDMVIFAESFLQQRLLPMVMAEVNAMMAGAIPGKNSLETDIVAVAQRSAVMDLFARSGVGTADAQKLKIDVASAMNLGMQTLEALTTVITEPLDDQLHKLNARAFGAQWDADAIRADSYRRSVRDTRTLWGTDSSSAYPDRFSSFFVDTLLLVQTRAQLRRSFHPDLYPVPPAGGMRGFTDDDQGSITNLWGFLCIQSLSLPNRDRFRKLCSGSSFGVDSPKNIPESASGEIKLNYDLWWNGYGVKHKSRTGWNGDDTICTAYDLQRRWKIYYMSLDQNVSVH